LICTAPTSNFLATVKASPISEVKIEDDKPAGWEFAMEMASAVSRAVIRARRGAKDSSW